MDKSNILDGQCYKDCEAVKKRRHTVKAAAVIAALVLPAAAVRIIAAGLPIGLLMLDGMNAKVYTDTDPGHYGQYMGENAREEYVRKWGMDESIFPSDISDGIAEDAQSGMEVKDYKMVYYDPWDAQYLSYLEVQYDDERYAAETARLAEYPSDEYIGYFGAEGFAKEYTLLAMEADPSFGLIYALGGDDNEIIYTELIFCNYFYDIDYKNMIREEYLPVGFDATKESAYRQQMLQQADGRQSLL